MKHNYRRKTATLLLTALGLSSVALASGIDTSIFNPNNRLQKSDNYIREYRGTLPFMDTENFDTRTGIGYRGKVAEGIEPSLEIENCPEYGMLNSPDGAIWFYTVEYDYDYIYHNEYYTQKVIKGYEFSIFDAGFNKIGTISDVIRLGEGETGVASCILDQTVTTRFYNSDDKPEVMVFIALNTVNNVNHYTNNIYTIGGEKTDEGYDRVVATMEGRCVDSINAGGTGDDEDFYITFVRDVRPNRADFDSQTEWAKNVKTNIKIYTKSIDGEAPQVAHERDMLNVCVPGDTTDGIYLISKVVNGEAYFIFSRYELPYLIDPVGGATDERATPGNSFLIDVLSISGSNVSQHSSTKIPVVIPPDDDKLYYTFYNLGAVAWKGDIDMTHNGTPNAPAYIITRRVVAAATLEDESFNIEIYGNDGNLMCSVIEDSANIILMNSEGNDQPHVLNMTVDENSNILFEFIDLYSGKKQMEIPQIYKGEGLLANFERVRGKDGKYKYVGIGQLDMPDSDGNMIKKMYWFNDDGSLDHIDNVNLGPDVQVSQVNMFAYTLDPYLYDADDAMEYAVLVKRTHGATTRNEFLVVDDNGEWYARFTADDGKGSPRQFSIYPGETNYLHMVYTGDNGFNITVFELPFFDTLGVGSIIDDSANVDGNAPAIYYDMQGRRINNPGPGMYIVKTGKTAKKVIVK